MKTKTIFMYGMITCLIIQMPATFALADKGPGKGGTEKKEMLNEPHWEFCYSQKAPQPEDLQEVEDNKLGKDIGFYDQIFNQLYVVKEEVVPGDPTMRTVIKKPDVFNAVRAIYKSLCESVKNHTLTKEEATSQMLHTFKVAIAVIDSDSSSFEKYLHQNKKETSSLISAFNRVTLQNIY